MSSRIVRQAYRFMLLSLMMMAIVGVSPVRAADEPLRVAFLVGVNVYDKRLFDDLKWAENDVNEMARALKDIGFDNVKILTGTSKGSLRATKANIETELDALLKTVKKTDIFGIRGAQTLRSPRIRGSRS